MIVKDSPRFGDGMDVALAVTVSGDTIVVSRGTFTVSGKTYVLEEDVRTVVSPDATDSKKVIGWLVAPKGDSGGTAELVVDEILSDGVDEPYDFAHPASAYVAIFKIFQVVIGRDTQSAILYVMSGRTRSEAPSRPEDGASVEPPLPVSELLKGRKA
jgi:hypothetical protein